MYILVSLSTSFVVLILLMLYQISHKRSVIPILFTVFFGIIATILFLVLSSLFPIFKMAGTLAVGFTEEMYRLIAFIILVAIWRRKGVLRTRLDYVVYLVPFSIGFTILENSLWDYSSGMKIALVRACTPGHMANGVVLAYGLFLYHRYMVKKEKGKAIRIMVAFYLFAALIHQFLDVPSTVLLFGIQNIPVIGLALFGPIISISSSIMKLSLIWAPILVGWMYMRDERDRRF